MKEKQNDLFGKRVAAYIRVSHDEQVKHGLSLDAQRENLESFIKDNNMKLVDFYVDEGITSRKRIKNRKEFQRMLSDIKSDNVDIILFVKLDRWFRNVKDYYITQDILDRHHVQWIATTEEYNTTTASGRLYLNIKLSIAQDEADRTSERINFVFDGKKRRCEALTGATPLGYAIKDKHYVIVPEEAEIVRFIYERYISGHSRRDVIDALQQNYDFSPTYATVRKILENPAYIGTFHGVENYAEPILDKETFYKAQEIAKKRSIRSNKTGMIYLFSGLLKCPLCGRNLHANLSSPHGYKYVVYYCPGHRRDNRCNFVKSVNENKLEAYLVDHISAFADQYVVSCNVRAKSMNAENLPAKKAAVQSKMDKLQELYINDLISIENYKAKYDKLKAEMKELKEKEKRCDIVPIDRTKNFKKLTSKGFKEVYWSLSRQKRRDLWQNVLAEIHYKGDNTRCLFQRRSPYPDGMFEVVFL